MNKQMNPKIKRQKTRTTEYQNKRNEQHRRGTNATATRGRVCVGSFLLIAENVGKCGRMGRKEQEREEKLGMAEHYYKPSTWEAEAGGL
jgi:hypothetical protein